MLWLVCTGAIRATEKCCAIDDEAELFCLDGESEFFTPSPPNTPWLPLGIAPDIAPVLPSLASLELRRSRKKSFPTAMVDDDDGDGGTPPPNRDGEVVLLYTPSLVSSSGRRWLEAPNSESSSDN